MTTRHFRIGIATALGVFLLESANAAEIIVSWTEVQQPARPGQRVGNVQRNIQLTLQGGNSISQRAETVSTRSGLRQSSNVSTRFRDSVTTGPLNVRTSWRVGDSKTLVRTQNWPQHSEVVRVVTQSESTCRAEVSYQLKPGFREYLKRSMSTGEASYRSALSAQNISCRVVS